MPPPRAPGDATADRQRRPLVLIVDDVPEYLTLLGELLAPDYAVKVASSGARALHIATEHPPDLVLLDVMMPEMDGYEVLEAMRHDARLRDVPVIFVTGLEAPDDQYRGFALGAADYVVKPYDAEIVRARVRLHLTLKQARDQLREQNATLSDEIAHRARVESEVRVLNGKLRARSNALERTVGDLRAFGYSISHDLRAPLRAIAGFTELLREHEAARLSDDGRGMLTHVTDGVARMERMIADVLAYSNAEVADVRLAPVDLGVLVAELAREAAATYPQTQIVVGELPIVEADRAMVRQILANLVGNALKFSAKAAHPKVEIGTEGGTATPVVVVRDNGVGFDARHASRLFGLFQRLHTEKAFPGTGVGLAIVKRLVERHGGCIRFESAPGAGATFRFTLGEDPSFEADPPDAQTP